jgi:hypothetical protein
MRVFRWNMEVEAFVAPELIPLEAAVMPAWRRI